MVDILPHSVTSSQPHSVGHCVYLCGMETLKQIVRENVRALMEAEGGPLKSNETGVTRLIQKGFANGTAQRILDKGTSIGIDVIESLATAFGVQPWQLMTKDLNPSSPPALIDQPGAWPFEFIDQRQYTDMPAKIRTFAQGRIKQVLDECAQQAGQAQVNQSSADLGKSARG